MRKLSFLGAICAVVFTLGTVNAQVTDTSGTGNDNGTSVSQDTTLRPDNHAAPDTVKGTLDNGRDQGIGTDTTDVTTPPSTNPDRGTGTNDNGLGTGTNGNDNGMGTGTNGTGTNGTGTDTGTSSGTGTDTPNGSGTESNSGFGTGTDRNR